ncbi:hypothetical protein AAL_00083 [Moelleriella libera RCEF 2490]|uniref:Peptide-N4-(N-acetyl-beta-glucosaminyl)asparagine amidase A n=1 Tax=Moelleriella libera RCEF 2490 TaxID=1081109 RepID=A0A166UJM5_9HYPO|nr:hypothetical protein AAL_00083 [Moelleriella libera RCEF 2490]
MLSLITPDPQHYYQHHQQHHTQYLQSHTPYYAPMPHREETSPVGLVMAGSSSPVKGQDAAVAQALEIARESPDGASDPTVSKILETALTQVWEKVKDHPDSYIMTKDEFSVFNYFQHRFIGNKMAVAARKRFWANYHG